MTTQIQNLTNKPIWLTLVSGNTVHIGALSISKGIEDIELKNLDKIKKLCDLKVIRVIESSAKSAAKASADKSKRDKKSDVDAKEDAKVGAEDKKEEKAKPAKQK